MRGLPDFARIVADRLDAQRFYALDLGHSTLQSVTMAVKVLRFLRAMVSPNRPARDNQRGRKVPRRFWRRRAEPEIYGWSAMGDSITPLTGVVVSPGDAATWLLPRWPSVSQGRKATIQLSLRSPRVVILRRSGAPTTLARAGCVSTTPNMSMAGGFGLSAPTSAYSGASMLGLTAAACSTVSRHPNLSDFYFGDIDTGKARRRTFAPLASGAPNARARAVAISSRLVGRVRHARAPWRPMLAKAARASS